ncbi:methylesterase 17-like [Macadamia integrifolia]|uniref:methylesterase 17-like n=1 Tax=Macadamia integrifolia TaxID=60698 RepID=UPI001C4FB814|nr:methylesterase 17-like [Macadamia integrifolia]XP_042510754.1 methylesterase 17-like [Macadamia integrifolia]
MGEAANNGSNGSVAVALAGGGEEESQSQTTASVSSLHFVLVHGIGHGAWCWYKIRCLLESSGHKVSCLDLKSAGIDPSDVSSVLTFDDYNQPLIDFLSALPLNDQVILVGHSAGGLSVSDAIHKVGKKIHVAIYVAATMLRCGFSTELDLLHGCPDLSEYGDVSELEFGLGPDQPPTSAIIKKEFQRQLMYNLSPLEDSILASALLRPAPVIAIQQAKFSEGPEADQVKRVYIKTLHDRVLTLKQQDEMIKGWPPSRVFELETDHSPNFSTPFELFSCLLKASTSTLSN